MTPTQKVVLWLGIGVVACLLVITGILVGAATVGWKAALRSGNETAAIQHLKSIDWAQNQYYATHGRRFGTFAELVSDSLLDARLRGETPVVDGYVYQLTINQDAPNAQPYSVTADPQDSSTGRNHFYRDSSSDEIRFNPDRRAGPKDPAWKKGP